MLVHSYSVIHLSSRLLVCSCAAARVCVLLLFCHFPILWWDLNRAAAKSENVKTCKGSFVALKSRCKDLDFWGVVVPDKLEIKEHIVQEMHSIPYIAHPGIQRTIAKVSNSFYWKGILVDVRQYRELPNVSDGKI